MWLLEKGIFGTPVARTSSDFFQEHKVQGLPAEKPHQMNQTVKLKRGLKRQIKSSNRIEAQDAYEEMNWMMRLKLRHMR